MRTDYIEKEAMQHALALLTPQNRKVMKLILQTGMRVSDAVSLPTSALRSNTYWYTESKTGKRRKVQLTDELRAELRKGANDKYVFPSRLDAEEHRTRQAVWNDLQRARKSLRIRRTFGTHSARKAFAVELMERYGDIGKVQKNLNHDRQSVTLLYAFADQITRKNKA